MEEGAAYGLFVSVWLGDDMAEVLVTCGDAVWRVCRADGVCSMLLRGLVKVSVTGKREANWEWFRRKQANHIS